MMPITMESNSVWSLAGIFSAIPERKLAGSGDRCDWMKRSAAGHDRV